MSCHTPSRAELREHSARLTAQRALILEDLYHHPSHCTVDAIFGRVSQRLP
jgi:Fe2+ or Zn2+ uptake regulation protein